MPFYLAAHKVLGSLEKANAHLQPSYIYCKRYLRVTVQNNVYKEPFCWLVPSASSSKLKLARLRKPVRNQVRRQKICEQRYINRTRDQLVDENFPRSRNQHLLL